MAAAAATAATTWLSNLGIRIGLNSFSFPQSTWQAYARSFDSFAKTQSATSSEMGLIEAIKKLIQGGRLTDEIKLPLRNAASALNAGWLPGSIVAAITAFIMSDTAKNAVNHQMKEFIEAMDEILKEHSKAHETSDEHHHETVEKFETQMQKVLQSLHEVKEKVITEERIQKTKDTLVRGAQATVATTVKAAGTNLSSRDVNPYMGIWENMMIKHLSAISSMGCALYMREKMQERGFDPLATNISTAFIDQFLKMLIDPHAQRKSLIREAAAMVKEGKTPIKVPTLPKIYEANFAAGGFFLARAYALWAATNKEGPLYQKFLEAGTYNYLTAPLAAAGRRIGKHYNQGANENFVEACKLSAKDLKLTNVIEAIESGNSTAIRKAFGEAILTLYKGAIPQSVATAIAAIILSKEFGEKMGRALDKTIEAANEFVASKYSKYPFSKRSEDVSKKAPQESPSVSVQTSEPAKKVAQEKNEGRTGSKERE